MVTKTELKEGSDAYRRRKVVENQRQQRITRQGQELGDIPKPKNIRRRNSCGKSLKLFLKKYFAKDFTSPWCEDHLILLAELQKKIRKDGLKAIAMPRGTGKTTICERAALWSILYGYHKFVVVVGANTDAASDLLQTIKIEVETNDLLAEDFPEVCIPIQAVAAAPQKQKGQTFKGERTRIEWSGKKKAVFPTIPGSLSSGSVIVAAGILSRIRGMKHVTEDGTVRPSFCLIDDPQTDESAKSDSQVIKRMRVMNGAILGLAGPGTTITALAPVTVIAVNDMADQILDRDAHPEWDGMRTKMLYGEAENKDLVDIYWDLRAEDSRTDTEEKKESNRFYRSNRQDIEAGLTAAWISRKGPGEVSAIQHALNLMQDRGKEVFDAEYQNDPQPEQSGDDWHLSQEKIREKVNGLPHRTIPLWCTKLTAFCDVQQRLLYWMVVAWGETGRGAIVDYGAWPEQPQREFNYLDVRATLGRKYPKRGIKGSITAGLGDLVTHLVEKDWIREDKMPVRVSTMGIDSGNWTKEIHEFVRTSKHAGMLFPTRGKGITADRRPISEWPRKANEKIGEEWILTPQPKHASRLITYDTNYYKYQLFLKLSSPLGEPEDLSLWGQETKFTHRMVASQFHAETFQQTEGQGRTVYVFAEKPSRPDNHLFDCAVGNCVLRFNGLNKKKIGIKKPAKKAVYL